MDGLSIGLFGGSFNPAHGGHLHVARAGLQQLGLDRVWWLVSPQNPLKSKQPSWESRVETVRALNLPPRMEISRAELTSGTTYTIDFIRHLQMHYPRTRFVFIMGADNLAQLPRWKAWQEILARVPIAVIARPGDGVKPLLSQAARQYAHARIDEREAHILQYMSAPAWSYLTLPHDPRSSSAIRAFNG